MSIRSGVSTTTRELCRRLLLSPVVSLRPVRRPNPGQPVAGHHVDDPEADVDRMVGDPFEIPVHEQVPRSRLDIQLALAHSTDDVPEVLVVQLVDRIIHLDDVADRLGVAPDERVACGVDHGDRPIGHLPDPRDVASLDNLCVAALERVLTATFALPTYPTQVGR